MKRRLSEGEPPLSFGRRLSTPIFHIDEEAGQASATYQPA
jgi:hypothetical protein